MLELFTPEAIGWALFHSLWQGLALTVVWRIAVWIQRNRPAQHRYVAGCVTLLAMAAAIPATLLYRSTSPRNASSVRAVSTTSPHISPEPVKLQPGEIETEPGFIQFRRTSARSMTDRLVVAIEPLLPYCTAMWLVGFGVFGVIRVLKFGHTHRRFARCGRLPNDLLQRCDQLSQGLGVSKAVRFVCADFLDAPATIGWLSPIVLVPAALMAGLTPMQVQALIAHELVHIRHRDYLVNLLQVSVETVLFYHPCVWLVSTHVRAERERRCDEVASQGEWGVDGYSEAVLTLIGLRRGYLFAPSAAGGSILERLIYLRRLRGGRLHPVGLGGAAAVILLGVATTMYAGTPLVSYAQEIRLHEMYLQQTSADVVWPLSNASRATSDAWAKTVSEALAAAASGAGADDPRLGEFVTMSQRGGDPLVLWREFEPQITLRRFPWTRGEAFADWRYGSASDHHKLIRLLWSRAQRSASRADQVASARAALLAASLTQGRSPNVSLKELVAQPEFGSVSGLPAVEVTALRQYCSYRADVESRQIDALQDCRQALADGYGLNAFRAAFARLIDEDGGDANIDWELAVMAASVSTASRDRAAVFDTLRQFALRPRHLLLDRLLHEAWDSPLEPGEQLTGVIQAAAADDPVSRRLTLRRKAFLTPEAGSP